MAEKITDEDRELLGVLGVETTSAKKAARTPEEQRIIAGFEEIERFVEEHGRVPQHGEERDIFERLYAVRLDRLRELKECRKILRDLDPRGLLGLEPGVSSSVVREEPSDVELLASLGVDVDQEADVTELVHVRSREAIRAAEEVAQRNPCKDFEEFIPTFEKVQSELTSRVRQTLKYKDNAEVNVGDIFILDGQKALVASKGEPFTNYYGRPDSRLRVIYDNGTESDLLVRSLQRALNKDKASRRITEPDLGPLFSDEESDDDFPTGFIYVLQSKSEHPFIKENRSVIHKIGVTGGDVKKRIANAKKDPTYLLAEVEVVGKFKLSNVNRKRLENLLHKFFASARLDLELMDRFGGQVEPKEWFLLPLPVIEEAIKKIKDGSIGNFQYDTKTAQIVG